MRWRELDDGTLVAPARGEPPECPDGYEQLEPYKCIPKLLECQYRSKRTRKTSCCVYDEIVCSVVKATVTRSICKACGGSAEWVATKLPKNVG